MKELALGLVLLALNVPAWSATQTVTLSVPGMNCPTCPITVRVALDKVPGVTDVKVDLDKRQSTVTFDDSKATVEALTRATTNAGYPSTLLRRN